MENASKALLIAGAILIAILLIGIGMMVFSNIGGITDQSGQQIDAMEIQMFNSKFEQYAGQNVSGSNVKALITLINANNATYSDDTSRQIKFETGSVKTNTEVGANYRYTVVFGKDAGSGFINSVKITKK